MTPQQKQVFDRCMAGYTVADSVGRYRQFRLLLCMLLVTADRSSSTSGRDLEAELEEIRCRAGDLVLDIDQVENQSFAASRKERGS